MNAAKASPWLRRVPRWVVLLLGLVCAGVGVVLIFRPFTSLSVLVALVSSD